MLNKVKTELKINYYEWFDEKEQKQVLDFAKNLLNNKKYEEKIALLQQTTTDEDFKDDMQAITNDFSYVDFE